MSCWQRFRAYNTDNQLIIDSLLEYSCQVATNERTFMIHFLNHSFSKNSILKSYLNNAYFNGRVASEEGKAYGKKILILAGKAQPKIIREDKLNELIIK